MPRVKLFKPSPLDYSGLEANIPRPSAGEYIGQGLQNLGASLTSIQNKRQNRIDAIYLLDKKNELRNRRRQEHLSNLKNIQLGDANGFTLKERERIEKEQESFLKDTPGRLKASLVNIFQTVNTTHLNRTASQVEIRQVDKWVKTTQAQAVMNAQKDAVTIPLGETESLFNVVATLAQELKEAPEMAELHGRNIIVNTLASWARINPKVTEEILIKYSNQFQNILGTDFVRAQQAIEVGNRLFKIEQEYNYKLSRRQRSDLEESTMKDGVGLFINPSKNLTIDWILGQEKNLNSVQMRTLYNMLSLQNSASTMTLDEVDWKQYAFLSGMVRDAEVKQIGSVEMINRIVRSIHNKQITSQQGQDLLKLITAGPKLSYEDQEVLNIIDDLEYDKNVNVNLAVKSKMKSLYFRWKIKNPTAVPQDFIDKTVLKSVERRWKRRINQYFEEPQLGMETFDLDTLQAREPYMTPEEQDKVNLTFKDFEKVGLRITRDVDTVNTVLEAIRRKKYIQSGFK